MVVAELMQVLGAFMKSLETLPWTKGMTYGGLFKRYHCLFIVESQFHFYQSKVVTAELLS